MAGTHFFNKPPAPSGAPKLHTVFIDVGGSPFHALATALIDYIDTNAPLKESYLKNIVSQLDLYYPHLRLPPPRLDPLKHMYTLMQKPRRSELLTCLAYVLRQMTIDTLNAEPMLCPEVFKNLSLDGADQLRQESTLLPASLLRLIPNALGINLILLFAEHDKELGGRTAYVTDGASGDITLQVDGNYYFPQLHNKLPFSYVGQLALKLPEPRLIPHTEPDSMELAKAMVLKDKEEVTKAYNRMLRTFDSMLAAGELTKEDLKNSYIQWLSQIDTHKEAYYGDLLSTRKIPLTGGVALTSEAYFVRQLTRSVALWVASNQVDEQVLFDSMSNPPSESLSYK
jgi:hypothetical protein